MINYFKIELITFRWPRRLSKRSVEVDPILVEQFAKNDAVRGDLK